MDLVPFYISYTALWLLVVLHSLILLGVVRMVYQLQQTGVRAGSSHERLEPGQEAPEFSTVDLYGTPVSSNDFTGRLTALLFVSPDCPTCMTVLEKDMEYLNHKAQGNLVVICRAGREACARLVERYELKMPVVADEDDRISRLYRISSVPMAVLINAENRIQSYGQPQREKEEEMSEKSSEGEVEIGDRKSRWNGTFDIEPR